MNFQEEVDKIKNLLTNAQEVLVAINKTPTLDSVASGLGLYLGLLKLGKKVIVFCEDEIKVEFSNLIAINKIAGRLGGKNFVISLDYKEGAINKVSYNIEGDKFNLVIEPRPDAPPLASDNVHYSYSGAATDLIFVIDTPSLQNLGKIYKKKREIFLQEKIIAIGRNQGNENFSQVNLIIPQAASTSEIITLLLKSLGVKLDQDMATNLLAGIVAGSNNFSSPQTNAATFEAAAFSLRAGGKKVFSSVSKTQKKPIVFPETKEEKKPSFAKVIDPEAQTRRASEDKEEKTPPDWLKPKIYKGSTLL